MLEEARSAQRVWSHFTLKERACLLRRLLQVLESQSESVATQIHHLNGKTYDEAMFTEVMPTLAAIDFAASKAARYLRPERMFLKGSPLAHSCIHYDPLGVVGFITPWNFPFLLAMADLPAALLAGNAVVIKPSEHCPGVGAIIENLVVQADLPKGLVQCIYGHGPLGQALIQSGIQKVCFIGSIPVGKLVYQAAAKAMIPCTLELGGKDAAIVLEDADLVPTSRGILWSGFANCGQACASVEVVYLPRRRYEEFKQRLQSDFLAMPKTQIGSMGALFQKKIVEEQLREARDAGARILATQELETPDNPYRLNAYLVENVPAESRLAREETFGPIMAIEPYDDVSEIVSRINQSRFGLTTSLWTKNYKRGEDLARDISTGVVSINDHMLTISFPEAPWGGHRDSGMGVSHSHLALRAFCKIKFVYHDRGLVPYKFWQTVFHKPTQEFTRAYRQAFYGRNLVQRLLGWVKVLPRLLRR